MVVGSSRGFPWKTTSIRTTKAQILLFCLRSCFCIKIELSERLRFLLISLLKLATLDFCHSLSILFSAVSLLWLCICKYRDTQTYSCSSRSRLLSALPCLTHFGCLWNTGRAFPACKGKTPLCGFCCQGKDQAIDSKSTTSASQFSFINIITEIRTKTHLIQTDLKAGW